MIWTVTYSRQAEKQRARLPERVKAILDALILEITANGPACGTWKNYSILSNGNHHCHLKKGSPTYVAVWQVTDKTIKLVEVKYVGTHEKAPY
ncbi:MAG: cytotoxic translational repressor of toxin-antitoxin stability system [Deltaproteobacteria bacterium]